MSLFIGCITITSGGQDFHIWVTDQLSNSPFTCPERCYSKVRAKMDREWEQAKDADCDPRWLDTQKDEFHYTDGFGEHTVACRVYQLETT